MNDNYQSGKTQAIDLDELQVHTANRPEELRVKNDFELDNWGDNPWTSTEESRKKRRWADDDKWSGDDEEKNSKPEGFWDASEEAMKAGWQAPKRGDVLVSSDGWDDWGNFDGAPKELDQEEEGKEFGGYRRVQAASQYAQVDTSNYVDGRAQRDDIYQSKEVYGTANVRERHGDPYANHADPYANQGNPYANPGDPYANFNAPESAPMPEMKPISEWGDEVSSPAPTTSQSEEDMRASAKINPAQTGDDIPGVTRASIIIFQANTEPVVFEVKKINTTIGRGLDNMVILNDQFASRHHLQIQYVSGRFELFALSPENIACVNGEPISHVVLMNNDQIEVGATRIRFVLGPISEQHMIMAAPINGKPMHLDPPPQEVRSPQTTRKNLILLIGAISVIVVFLLIIFIAKAVSKDETTSPDIANNDGITIESDDANAGSNAEDGNKLEFSTHDRMVIEGMMEAFGAATGNHLGTSAKLYGNKVMFSINSEPEGARIYNADGSLRGVTPYKGKEFVSDKDQSETWTIRKDGYLDYELEVKLSDSVKEIITLEPEEAAKPKPAPAPAKPKPKATGSSKKPAKKKTPKPAGRRVII